MLIISDNENEISKLKTKESDTKVVKSDPRKP